MMKGKSMAAWAAALSAVFLGGCMMASGDSGAEEQIGLYERGLRLVEKMDVLAESVAWRDILTTSAEMSAVLEDIGNQDYSNPRAVYQVKQSNELNLMVEYLGGESEYADLPEEIRQEMEYRLASSIPSRLSAMSGAEVLAAVSMIASSDHFIDSSVTENISYFYIYDSGYWGAVTFLPCGEGIVHASGLMIKNDFVGQDSGEEEILQWLAEYGNLLGADISKIVP